MTKVTHTPGPWHVEPLQWDHGASIAIVANGQIICTIAPENEEDDVTMETAIRGPRDEANACLIAVAPEMLDEALKPHRPEPQVTRNDRKRDPGLER